MRIDAGASDKRCLRIFVEGVMALNSSFALIFQPSLEFENDGYPELI
ncbi:MAG: hypothetical protein ABJL55_13825 [Roseibium sp.]